MKTILTPLRRVDICDPFIVNSDELFLTFFLQRFYGRRKRRRRTANVETEEKTTPRVDSPEEHQSSILMEEISVPKVAATTCYFCINFTLFENIKSVYLILCYCVL